VVLGARGAPEADAVARAKWEASRVSEGGEGGEGGGERGGKGEEWLPGAVASAECVEWRTLKGWLGCVLGLNPCLVAAGICLPLRLSCPGPPLVPASPPCILFCYQESHTVFCYLGHTCAWLQGSQGSVFVLPVAYPWLGAGTR